MAAWNNENEMFELMKEKLYTPVVGDILDQMGYKHQFLPAPVRPLAAQVPTEPYKLRGEQQDNRLKVDMPVLCWKTTCLNTRKKNRLGI